MIYCAESTALCALEVLVNSAHLPAGCVRIEVTLPDDMRIERKEIHELPADWNQLKPSKSTRDIGSNWCNSGPGAVLSVPSVVVSQERNYLLNPLDLDFNRIAFGDAEPFLFDPRLK